MSIIKGIKVGRTNITSTYNDDVDKSDIKQIEVTAVSLYYIGVPEDVIYTGFEHCPHPIVKAIVNDEEIVLEEGIDYVLSYSNNINVGKATVFATGIGNFKDEISSSWMIENANMTVIADDQSKIYDGKLFGNPIYVETINNQQYDIKYGLNDGVYNLDSAPQIKNVSESKNIYYKITAPNHNTIVGSYELSITPKIAELQWGESYWVYDGNSHSTTCHVSNLVGNDTCDVNILYNNITNIGSVDVYASSLSNSNYILPSDGLWHTITIKPGMFYKVDGNWTPVKSVYKKVSGSWVKQELNSSFSTSGNYVKM